MLTTITPVWDRPEALQTWLAAVEGWPHKDVRHLVYVVNGPACFQPKPSEFVDLLLVKGEGNESIAHWHTQGAHRASTEWIMKLDVDALPNVHYFNALLCKLKAAKPREWFNGGMLFIKQAVSEELLLPRPVFPPVYDKIMQDRKAASARSYSLPASTNWICRREDYLQAVVSPALSRFRGWGWEDYLQIYLLERNWLGKDPLPGPLDWRSVTRRCRDEISRPKALALFESHPALCLLHRWHPVSTAPGYREHSQKNRQHLLEGILEARKTLK